MGLAGPLSLDCVGHPGVASAFNPGQSLRCVSDVLLGEAALQAFAFNAGFAVNPCTLNRPKPVGVSLIRAL